jgi:hypothetical protein
MLYKGSNPGKYKIESMSGNYLVHKVYYTTTTPPEPKEWVRPAELDLSLEYETRSGKYLGKYERDDMHSTTSSMTIYVDGGHSRYINGSMFLDQASHFDLFPVGLGPNTKGLRSSEFNKNQKPDAKPLKSCSSATFPHLFLDGHVQSCALYVAPIQQPNVWGIARPPERPVANSQNCKTTADVLMGQWDQLF